MTAATALKWDQDCQGQASSYILFLERGRAETIASALPVTSGP